MAAGRGISHLEGVLLPALRDEARAAQRDMLLYGEGPHQRTGDRLGGFVPIIGNANCVVGMVGCNCARLGVGGAAPTPNSGMPGNLASFDNILRRVYRDPVDADRDAVEFSASTYFQPVHGLNGVFWVDEVSSVSPSAIRALENWSNKWSKMWRAVGVAHCAAVYMLEVHTQVEVNSDTKEEVVTITNEPQILLAAFPETGGVG